MGDLTHTLDAAIRPAPMQEATFSRSKITRGLVIFEHSASILIAVVLLTSSLLHLDNQYYFLSSMYSYEIAGPQLGKAMAMLVPYVQLVVSTCLLGRIAVGGALLLSVGMFGMFSFAQAMALWRGLDIACGCFGAAYSSTVGAGSLASVVALFCIATASLFAYLAHTRSALRA